MAFTLATASSPVRSSAGADVRWFRGFSSSDPYPLAVELRNARMRGSFGAAYNIAIACQKGLMTIGRSLESLGASLVRDMASAFREGNMQAWKPQK